MCNPDSPNTRATPETPDRHPNHSTKKLDKTMSTQLTDFRLETRQWLAQHCPASMRTPMPESEIMDGGTKRPCPNPDSYVWLRTMAAKGWTAPMWPRQYGGGGLNKDEYLVLIDELLRINARPPLQGMGLSMIGPTLLEFGTEEQKLRHLPRIVRGEVWWCQGYSEPGAGSDLASLQTRADDQGDHFVVNGSKIWTSSAQFADWIFCLVRTNREAPKHEGISFLLFSMDSPGVSVKPIRLINGASPFCQTFFDDVIVPKADLIHKVNHGWTVAKRLLQYERSGMDTLVTASRGGNDRTHTRAPLQDMAKARVGADGSRIADPALRESLLRFQMNTRAFALTQQRTVEEADGGKTPGAATSIFKLYGAELTKTQLEIQLQIRGFEAMGWEEDEAGEAGEDSEHFDDEALRMTRLWLESKAASIAGGSNEVQLNIIAKRVLGLPD